ncbi:hypothetical protein QGN23_01000 [Chryseobacterium gotjawalense]|uniref:Uncharacterized protein n=1 Tax=Chryseobacterium gotjawalense TaxID=3042315 RepID=A0ABY8RD09_9FLAO|nr:hypothetical protein [Chryseobacterium sp. wdc7]WHF51870.1 hypothetical protein QGN23_01000 [Chryseobacterium sp. wdc7]
MIDRKITFLGTKLKAVPYFNTQLIELTSTGTYEIPFETQPTIGEKHDYKICKTCIKNHKKIHSDLTKLYEGKMNRKAFPNCCPEHSMLIHLPIFKKTDYDKVPKMVADKVIFTLNHIKNNIDSDDYYYCNLPLFRHTQK